MSLLSYRQRLIPVIIAKITLTQNVFRKNWLQSEVQLRQFRKSCRRSKYVRKRIPMLMH